MAESTNTPGAMPETTQTERDAPAAEREAESSEAVLKALKAERKERDALAKKLKAYEDAEKTRAEEDAKRRGDFETLEKRLKAEVESERTAKINIIKEFELRKIADKLINPDLIDEAIEKAVKAFDYKDGELSGKQSPDEWFSELIKAKKVYAKPAAQTPSLRGTMPSGGLAQPDISKMTPAQKMAYARAKK